MKEKVYENYFDIRFEHEKLYNTKRIEDEIEKRNLQKSDCIINTDSIIKNSDGSCVQRVYYK